TGAPTTSPRTDSLKTSTYVSTTVSGRFTASSRLSNRTKVLLGLAGAALRLSSGGWKEMPPIRIDVIDSVLTFTPLASRETSIPLACQKRVVDLTYWS